MSDKSPISWLADAQGRAGATWNPIRAINKKTGGNGHYCARVNEACRNCYAARQQPRFQNPIDYDLRSLAKVDIVMDCAVLAKPSAWRRSRTIFVASMSDLYGDWVPTAMIDAVKAVEAIAARHHFIELTKRPNRAQAYHADPDMPARVQAVARDIFGPYQEVPEFQSPLPNVSHGCSVHDQESAEAFIPLLMRTEVARRVVSYEPALGRVDFRAIHLAEMKGLAYDVLAGRIYQIGNGSTLGAPDRPRIDEIFAGGESGPGARPAHPDWFRSVRDQCQATGTAFHFKQWGEWAPIAEWQGGTGEQCAIDFAGTEVGFDANPDEVGGQRFARVGKKAAGRLLDGMIHNGSSGVAA